MDDRMLREAVLRMVLGELARQGDMRIPVNASNRHIHLCQQDVEALFGAGYRLRKMRDLLQPGQYACHEQVTMQTDGGQLTLRVVGPVRRETQIELSVSEAVRLKIEPMVRLSGDIQGTPGCWLINGERRTRLQQGIIVAARHMHISPEEAMLYGLKHGDKVSLYVSGPRKLTFHDVIVRSGPGHVLEAHIDREEANACGLKDGQLCRIILGEQAQPLSPMPPAVCQPQTPQATPQRGKALLTETDVLAAINRGQKEIRYTKNTIVTPLARDAAWEKNVELIAE